MDERVLEGLRQHFTGECSEVGMYLAMSRVADRKGIRKCRSYKRIAFEEAEHAAKFAELLGEVVTDSTKKNLEMRAAAEQVPAPARRKSPPWPNSWATMPSTTPFMKWPKTKPVTAVYSTDCWPGILQNKKVRQGRGCCTKGAATSFLW